MEIEIESRGFLFEDSVVSTEWLSNHLDNPGVRVLETNKGATAFATGHIPNSVEIELTALLTSEYDDGKEFGSRMSDIGVTPETQLVLCGDYANVRAAESLWICVLFGHAEVRLLDGGRDKWMEERRTVTDVVPEFTRSKYDPLPRDNFSNRASLDDVLQHSRLGNIVIDVRPQEDYKAMRVPGAANVYWQSSLEPSAGTFKCYDELMSIYGDYGPDEDVIVYGEGGCHTWFVLKYLLGFPNVRFFHGFDPTSFPAH